MVWSTHYWSLRPEVGAENATALCETPDNNRMRIGNLIYLDHQSTTPVDPAVFDAMSPFFGDNFGNPHSIDHIMGWASARAVDEAAARIGALISADADEIIFTSGATEANNLALLGLGRRMAGGQRRKILCSAIEHKSVLASVHALCDFYGYELGIVPVDNNGHVSLTGLHEQLSEQVLVVSIVLVNNEIGTIQNVSEISTAVSSTGAILHCDAAQAPCAIDLREEGPVADMLSLSGHKMYGPKGIGVLYVRRELQARIEPMIYGGGQQRNLRSGTVPTPLCVGMGAAADLLLGRKGEAERKSVSEIRDRFINGLKALDMSVKLNGPVEQRHPGNANVCFEGFSAQDILDCVQNNVSASTGAACSSGMPELSHVLYAIGLSEDDARGSVRFSIGRNTTRDDVDDAVTVIGRALKHLASTLKQT